MYDKTGLRLLCFLEKVQSSAELLSVYECWDLKVERPLVRFHKWKTAIEELIEIFDNKRKKRTKAQTRLIEWICELASIPINMGAVKRSPLTSHTEAYFNSHTCNYLSWIGWRHRVQLWTSLSCPTAVSRPSSVEVSSYFGGSVLCPVLQMYLFWGPQSDKKMDNWGWGWKDNAHWCETDLM